MEVSATVIELRPTANANQFTRTHVVADTREEPTLTVRPLKKHTNIRLGAKIDLTGYPSKSSLFVISNKHGWFFAGHGQTILGSPLSELRTSIAQNNSQEEVEFQCQLTLGLAPTIPLFVVLAAGESRLIVASSSSMSVWDVQAVINGETNPIHTAQFPELVIIDVHPNPGDYQDLVAVLATGHSQEESCALLLFNCLTQTETVRWAGTLKEGNAPVAASWSTRGKQIAIATSSGDILQYSPAEPTAAKATIPRAQGPDLNGTVPLFIQWLSNFTFHVIYAEPRPEASLDDYQPTQHNYIITYDKKTNHATDVQLPLPWDPWGLSREPGHQMATLRSWGRFKYLLFVNDAHATDVGIVGCIGDANTVDDSGVWTKISLGDESLTFPMSSDMEETSLIGMDVDLSAEKQLLGASQANGDDPTIPPAPILYLFTNDAVVVAFHIVNEDGLPYPGMFAAAGSREGVDTAMDQAPVQAPVQAPTQAPAGPAAVKSGFAGFANANPSAFGQTGFGSRPAAPTFGSTGFGSATSTPFGGSTQPATTGPSLGFGAFANSNSTFGQSNFGSSTTTQAKPAFGSGGGGGFAAFASSKPTFGQPSLATNAQPAFAAKDERSSGAAPTDAPKAASPFSSNPFGAPAQPSPFSASAKEATPKPAESKFDGTNKATESTTASSTTFKPAAGFGAFSGFNSGTPSPFLNPKPAAPSSTPTTFAGAGVSAAAASAATTAPKFGATTAFGRSSFGQSSLGSGPSPFSAFAATPATKPTTTFTGGGGFSAFASSATGFASLSNDNSQTKTPAYLEQPKDGPGFASKISPPVANDPMTPKSVFGTNAAVSKPGFGQVGLRAKSTSDDEDDTAKQTGEKFPEEDADKLEPERRYEGPGLFGDTGSKKSAANIGALDIRGQTPFSSATAKASHTTTQSAFGQKQDASKIAAAAAAAFKPGSASGSESPAAKAASTASTSQLPKSAFPQAGSTSSAKSLLERISGSSGEKREEQDDSFTGTGDLEDDINEFLEEGDDDDLEEVEIEDEDEDEEEDEGEDEEDEDEEEDEEEEDEEEEDEEAFSDVPELDEEDSPDEHPVQPRVRLVKGTQPQPVRGALGASTSTSGQQVNRPGDAESSTSKTNPAQPSGTPTRPQPVIQPVGSPINPFNKPKPRPASPKAAFGAWAPPPASSSSANDTAKQPRPKTPPLLFGSGKSAAPATMNAPATSISPSKSVPQQHHVEPKRPPSPVPVQPQHPELQAQLDRVLHEYTNILYSISERAKKTRSSFEKLKGLGSKPLGKENVRQASEWTMQDLPAVKQLIKETETAVSGLLESISNSQSQLSDLQSMVLRTEMKREEAFRYLNARRNPEFVEKVIKPRALGPEHAENQLRLRKGIKLQTERINEVEEHIQRLKKDLEMFKAGKSPLQVPTLEMIRRTCQNIDWGITEKSDMIAALATRVDSLPSLPGGQAPRRLSPSLDRQLPSRTSSITAETIKTTVEVFSGEVKMTKLGDLIVQSRPTAPLNEVDNKSRNSHPRSSSSFQRGVIPFHNKTIILRDMPVARPAAPASKPLAPISNQAPAVPPNVTTPTKQDDPVVPQTDAPRTSPGDLHRRTNTTGSRSHVKAPQFNKNAATHTSDFSWGPLPATPVAQHRLPANFVPLVPSPSPNSKSGGTPNRA